VIWVPIMAVIVIGVPLATGKPMPYLSNVINVKGIGSLTLLGDKPPLTSTWVFWMVTIATPFVGAAQAAVWTDAIRRLRADGAAAIVPLAGCLMAVLTFLIVILWDEYLIVFIPAAMFLTLRLAPITRAGLVSAAAVCVAMFLYGAAEMADYMAWNRARWSAANALVAEGIPPEEIAGGLEWVGWHEFERTLPIARQQGLGRDLLGWMKVTPDRVFLSFSPIDGYRIRSTVPYESWLGGRRQLFVLERQ